MRRRQRMRSANALLISLVACRAPNTVIDSMVAKASSGDTSGAMLVSPSTLMCSFSPAALAASKSARVKCRSPSSSVCRTIDFLTSST